MTATARRIASAAAAGALIVAAPIWATAQTAHDHHDASAALAAQAKARPMMAPSVEREALDARIRMLASDMRMLTGDLKVEAMAALLTAMLERQALVEAEMRTMRDSMMTRMADRAGHAQPMMREGVDRPAMMGRRDGEPRVAERQAAPAVPADPEPEEMCAPAN